MTDKLDPAEVLRDLDDWVAIGPSRIAQAAATLIRQMQAAMVEADRRARGTKAFEPPQTRAAIIVEPLTPFLPKPDKLVEAMREALPASMPDHHVAAIVRNLNDYCAKHGGTITWKDGE